MPSTARQTGVGAIRMEVVGDGNGNNKDDHNNDNNAQQLHKYNKLLYMPI
jgi:hypothetical protein